jgi:hypothetical protein
MLDGHLDPSSSKLIERRYNMSHTYLTTAELAARIKYDTRTIRDRMKDTVLLEGVHYFRPFGGRKILYVWERIERDMRADMFGFGLPAERAA